MSIPRRAVICDVDGVLMPSAALHRRAWKSAFDEMLHARGGAAFTDVEYRRYVDGKPRYQGAADFLEARQLDVPRGSPDDAPGTDTVCAVANLKNARFVELLDDGIAPFSDVTPTLVRWRRGGLGLAAISASRNCRRVLEAGELLGCFDVVVDGLTAEEQGLADKADILRAAARCLDVAPEQAVVVEDATAGVAAACQVGFGLVVGLARSQGPAQDELSAAGARHVVASLGRVRFCREIPPMMEHLDALEGEGALALFLDFDGTLAEIVEDPDAVRMTPQMHDLVQELARQVPVAIISGRDLEDVQRRAPIEDAHYAGSHGIDIAGPRGSETAPAVRDSLVDVEEALDAVGQQLGDIDGVIIETKRYSVAVHFRQVDDREVRDQIRAAVRSLAQVTGLRCRRGKEVLELEPDVDWDKGRALQRLIDAHPEIARGEGTLLYIGDDETDEDAFAALGGDGLGIMVGARVAQSLADYGVSDPGEVEALLRWIHSERVPKIRGVSDQ